jgi:hypothetical protein
MKQNVIELVIFHNVLLDRRSDIFGILLMVKTRDSFLHIIEIDLGDMQNRID